MFPQTVALVPAAHLEERPHRERFNAGEVIQIILELTTQMHLTRIYDTGHTFLTLLYQARYTQVLIINYTLIGFLVNSLYVISSVTQETPGIYFYTTFYKYNGQHNVGDILENGCSKLRVDFKNGYIGGTGGDTEYGSVYFEVNSSWLSSVFTSNNCVRPLSSSCKFFIRYV